MKLSTILLIILVYTFNSEVKQSDSIVKVDDLLGHWDLIAYKRNGKIIPQKEDKDSMSYYYITKNEKTYTLGEVNDSCPTYFEILSKPKKSKFNVSFSDEFGPSLGTIIFINKNEIEVEKKIFAGTRRESDEVFRFKRIK